MKMKNFHKLISETKATRQAALLAACLFWFCSMTAMAQTVYYAKPQESGTANGLSWTNATTLDVALELAKSGDEVRLQGFETVDSREKAYAVPTGADGFAVRQGVKIYGGFSGTPGTETTETPDNRARRGDRFEFRYISVVVADRKKNDEYFPAGPSLIFPTGDPDDLRADNAPHVFTLTAGSGTQATELDGLTIAAAHNTGTTENNPGGGVVVTGSGTYHIRHCFFLYNYAPTGGAIYVHDGAGSDASTIESCYLMNNAAGTRSSQQNDGGGIYLAGRGMVVNTVVANNENGGILMSPEARVVQSTVTRNTAAAVELTDPAGGSIQVYNTVIWGNSALYATEANKPGMSHCAYPEATPGTPDPNGNIYAGANNFDLDDQPPLFDDPSPKMGFNQDFDWQESPYPDQSYQLRHGSVLIDRGAAIADLPAAVRGVLALDPIGTARPSGTLPDIGAYEYRQVETGHIRYVKAGGTGNGTSWSQAMGDLQQAIDDLADMGGRGEVWVAAGTYRPTRQLVTGNTATVFFRMRDGISVYGGFPEDPADGMTRDDLRQGDMPWQMQDENGTSNETILEGYGYNGDCTWSGSNNSWTPTSESCHVVWFAPLDEGEGEFRLRTELCGVTIRGGYASGNSGTDGLGGGVYMQGERTALVNCVVKENRAQNHGGGVYLKGGRVEGCLIYNNSAVTGHGGAVYADTRGEVLRCMMANNSGRNGGAVFMNCPAGGYPGQLTLSTSVVSNNQSLENGAVYCYRGGTVVQSTIVNNYTPRATDAAMSDASKTGGLYLYEYGLVVNSVLWNNHNGASDNAPFYALNPATDKVRFYNSAVSGYNSAVWYNILQEDVLRLSDDNNVTEAGNTTLLAPDFSGPVAGSTNFADAASLRTEYGIQEGWTAIDYLWQAVQGSNLRAQGLPPLAMPSGVSLIPQVDLKGDPLHSKPALGAHRIDPVQLVPEKNGSTLRLYVDVSCQEPEHDGSSWERGYRSVNEAISYMADLTKAEMEAQGVSQLEIYVLQSETIYPRYTFASDDPKSATIEVPAMQSGLSLTVKGGFADNDSHDHDPLTYRSVIDGNPDGRDPDEGLYHCITVRQGANVTFEGFHIINGNAAGEAVYLQGGGLFIEENATVTLRRCIIENCSANQGAAIYGGTGSTVNMDNCVVNNNTNNDANAASVIAGTLRLRHVTFANNMGGSYAQHSGNASATNCLSMGNTASGSNNVTLAANADNFQNPTNDTGATLGFDTYRGGYSSFKPLTSSVEAADQVINKTNTAPLAQDIAGRPRDLGGTPDLGAYEAELPEAKTVLYVTPEGAGKRDGSSWENAIAGNYVYNLQTNTFVTETEYDDWTGTDRTDTIHTYNSKYAGEFNRQNCPYGESSKFSETSVEFEHNNKGLRDEQYISGLQYAVEKATEQAKEESRNIQVWVSGGTYTDYKGYVIRDQVDVYGGFPNEGTPGMDDRHPLLSTSIPLREADEGLADQIEKYETIIQIQEESPVRWTYRDGYYYPSENQSATESKTRKPVLFQPDVCMTTYGPTSDNERISSSTGAIIDQRYVDYKGASWDGFTIQHGFYKGYTANRDGGAGVRMFRGMTLRNCVVKDNYNEGNNDKARGGGIYCDGRNSYVINCYIINNAVEATEDNTYGGGMYMIVGTGYNLLVANNYSEGNGGGIFIEDATFYNCTIAYNNTTNGHTGGLYQYTGTTANSTLTLYNCLLYYNREQVLGSHNATYFTGIYYSFIEGAYQSDLAPKIDSSCETVRGGAYNPFEDNNAQRNNNFRLNSTTWCVNHGTEDIPDAELPETDVDFTDRIKDCRVDVGAYELDNTANIQYNTNTENGITTATYYVTQAGRGTRNGGSLDQAACAEKLQDILDAAGQYVAGGSGRRAIVKVAGYNQSENPFVYHPNEDDLSAPNDPQSYTYTVPYGVTLMGGYKDISATVTHWDETTNPNCRDILNYPTLLSPVVTLSDGQQVNGHHTVTFGTKPTNYSNNYETTILDGVTLMEGQATASGGDNDKGGGAVVPAWGHVRNCIVRDNTATSGGGLYLEAGATVSGTLVRNNTATYGAGIYAANGHTGAEAPTATAGTYIISSTIAGNTSDDTGGGLYLEDGAAVTLNSVIWGNEASSDMNISGVTENKYEDQIGGILMSGSGTTAPTEIYLFNSCFVEQTELPATFEQNTSMTREPNDYFADEVNYMLRAFSPLIKSGMPVDYQTRLVTDMGVASADINRLARIQGTLDRLDVGAFAFDGGRLSTDNRFTRLFVAATGRDPNLSEEVTGNINDYLGRSFYTPFSHLDEALAYVREVRKTYKEAREKTFEILIAEGTYKPTYKRDNNTAPGIVNDQRLNSFNVPYGVQIYGGFSGKELYLCNKQFDDQGTGTEAGITTIPGIEGDWQADGDINGILAAREQSDLNSNGILEPWEMSYQSILSGNINVSTTETNAYHVVYTDTENEGNDQTYPIPDNMDEVTLDGLTIMDGQTANTAYAESENAQEGTGVVGRGGGIYSKGVKYTLNRCRLLRNRAVIGNAIYVRDAGLRLFGSMLAGNSTVDDPKTEENNYLGGGAAMVYGGDYGLKAFNTLWANNETTGDGGAAAVFPSSDAEKTGILLVNNTLVRNKSAEYAVTARHGDILNTLAWGNEYTDGANPESFHRNLTSVRYSATEENRWTESQKPDGTTDATGNHNITVSADNGAVDGPRFAAPSATAGVAGFSSADRWNPGSISILTDAGDGMVNKDQDFPASADEVPTYYDAAENYGYKNYLYQTYDENGLIRHAYMKKEDDGLYLRYSGPKDENNQDMDRIIDIGLYEYQYNLAFDKMDTIYVATMDAGEANGLNWANATSDLRGAIVGLANASDDQNTTPEENWPYNAVLVRQGEYANAHTFAGNTAFNATMGSTATSSAQTLSIRGSYNEQGVQDFSNPTVIYAHPDTETETLLDINVPQAGREVFVEGILFHNAKEDGTTKGDGIRIHTTHTDNKVTLKNVQVRGSGNGAVVESGSQGGHTLVNVLFAYNDGTGLAVAQNATATVINGTFAQNKTDFTGNPAVYNSVSWENGTQSLTTDNNNNVSFPEGTENDDIVDGPNFVNPSATDVMARDYHIRPGITLLDKGNNERYEDFIRTYRYPGYIELYAEGNNTASDEQHTQNKAAETDLGGTARFVDRSIDVGAYEYAAPMRQIIYVDDRLTTAGDGSSWENALTDLQDAVNLAGIYANTRPDEYGYVFAQSTVGQDGRAASLNVQLGGTKVYGGMHTERYTGSSTKATDIVAGLLAQRRGMMESQGDHSQVTQLVIKPAQGEGRNTATSVVDGFQVTGGATVGQGGMLSTSIVEDHGGTFAVTMENDGILYNSFVDGAAGTTGTIVNVTATGTIAAGTNENNRPSTTTHNRYIQSQTDAAWNYQLNEESTDIDHNGNSDISGYIGLAGHNRDLAGNTRVMNGTPDNGCFETWSVPATTTDATAATIWKTEDHSTGPYDAHVALGKHYPVAGSVVYVNKGSGLAMNHTTTADAPFRPGYLLLKEGASLYGNGRDVSLPYVATERTLSQGWNLCAVPYALTRDGISRVDTDGGSLSLDVLAVADSTETYDGAARAASLFAFHETNSAFWNPATSFATCQGFALKAAEAAGTYRFTAGAENGTAPVYSETADETEKTVALTQYDQNTVDGDGTPKFTFKENMGWNLFGLPYLVSGYDLTAKLTGTTTPAMDLPHILYTLQDGQYFTVQSWDGTTTRPDGTTDGTLSFGKGVFTQTAVIGDGQTESLRFRRPSAPGETTDGNGVNLQQYRLGLWGETGADGFVFSPTNEETDGDFTLGADGLKMMAPRADAPQLYAVNRTGTRFSLMNAVDAAGSVQVGIRAVAGDYTMGLGETADIETATEVWLTDHKTGAKVDLRRTDYRFTLTEAADDAARFTLSFSSIADDTAGTLNVYVRRRILYVEGLREGDTVTLYDPSGTRVHAERTTGGSFRHALKPGIYLVHVSGQKSARKVFVQ